MLPIGKQINLMHVADHGMISSSNIKGSVLDYLKPSWLEYAAVINPVMSIRTRHDNQDSISKALNKYQIDFIMVLTREL
jgi:alkaline phosphatase D